MGLFDLLLVLGRDLFLLLPLCSSQHFSGKYIYKHIMGDVYYEAWIHKMIEVEKSLRP